jgi:hypothetical protein
MVEFCLSLENEYQSDMGSMNPLKGKVGYYLLMSTLEESLIANFGSTKVWVMDPSLFDG